MKNFLKVMIAITITLFVLTILKKYVTWIDDFFVGFATCYVGLKYEIYLKSKS